MKKGLLMLAMALMATLSVCAQEEFLGNWYTVDDKTGNNYAIVKIFKASDGKYYGRIDKMLVYADAVCDKCTGAEKDKPVQGMLILRGLEYKNGEMVNGRCLDPESGKFYYGKLSIKKGHLVLRGSLDKAGILGRSQTWNRGK